MKQDLTPSVYPGSVFRTRAWVQAWIDTWGKHPNVTLIDLGGRQDPLEQVYIARHYLKRCLPINLLSLAGVGCAAVSTPRAEYIDLAPLIRLAGSANALADLLAPLKWQRFFIPDVLQSSNTYQQLQVMSSQLDCTIQVCNSEFVYGVSLQPWTDYVASLGSNTRLTYVNRRKNLLACGQVEHESWPLEQADQFFVLLNQFHQQRWHQPCFSVASQTFLKNFGTRLKDENGQLLFKLLRVNDEIVTVLLDIEWSGNRYNLQSGFYEQRFPKIALGALHLGYGIEEALHSGLHYDFMAGRGKHTNYKARIATNTRAISSYYLERGLIKSLRQLKRRIFTSGNPV